MRVGGWGKIPNCKGESINPSSLRHFPTNHCSHLSSGEGSGAVPWDVEAQAITTCLLLCEGRQRSDGSPGTSMGRGLTLQAQQAKCRPLSSFEKNYKRVRNENWPDPHNPGMSLLVRLGDSRTEEKKRSGLG